MRATLPDGTVREGRGLDLVGAGVDVDAESVVWSIRHPESADAIRIECHEPGPGHARLCRLPVSDASRSHLLAAVGRSRGMTTPVDDELARLTTLLADASVDDDHSAELRAVRRRLADAGDDEARLRERAATLRGRLVAHREAGADDAVEAIRSELVAVTTELSETETERIAAEQRLDALERAATEDRDRRDERLRLADAVANRRRDARAFFADTLAAEFDAARDELAVVSSGCTPPSDGVVAGLAAVRLADLRAPVVTTCRFFPDAETAVRHLDAPVVRL